jgi:hypothetical protein
MNETPHSDCKVCSWWEARIAEHRKRALKGSEKAFRKERRARRELAGHLGRTGHYPVDGREQ